MKNTTNPATTTSGLLRGTCYVAGFGLLMAVGIALHFRPWVRLTATLQTPAPSF
jgi:hypothetical protein